MEPGEKLDILPLDGQSSRPATSVAGTGVPLRVLVVDDDPLIVAATAAILQDLGHEVIEASSGPHALDALRAGANVDLVITDYAMPGMTGSELAQQIRRIWPALPVILATGYADLPNAEERGLPRLSKPYRQQDLAAQVAQVARSRPRASERIA